MDLVLTVFEIVAPVFLLASVGFAWCRLGHAYPTEFITRFAMTLALPCLIFVALMDLEIAPSALAALSLATLVAYGALILIAWIGVRAAVLDRASFVAPLAFGNTGNLGLPLALFAFGDTGLGLAVVVFAVMTILAFSIGLWLVGGSSAASPGRILREPILWATMIGALFLVFNWTTPSWLTRGLELIGQMAIPMMLVTLGVAVARLKPGGILRALILSIVKLAVSVAAGLAAGLWFDLPPVALGVLILQLATPVAVTSYLLAERYGADADAVAGLVMVSTLLSVLMLPITLSFLLSHTG